MRSTDEYDAWADAVEDERIDPYEYADPADRAEHRRTIARRIEEHNARDERARERRKHWQNIRLEEPWF